MYANVCMNRKRDTAPGGGESLGEKDAFRSLLPYVTCQEKFPLAGTSAIFKAVRNLRADSNPEPETLPKPQA